MAFDDVGDGGRSGGLVVVEAGKITLVGLAALSC